MRLNTPHNALRGGGLFFYRDIFSGLSNETTGSASYSIPVMDPAVHSLIATVHTYQPLLFRYATFLIKNKLVAALIVDAVIEDYSQQAPIIPASATRAFLQTCTYHHCAQWLAAKPTMLHLRKPKNPT